MDLALVRAWVLALTLAATGAGAEAPPDEVQRLLGHAGVSTNLAPGSPLTEERARLLWRSLR